LMVHYRQSVEEPWSAGAQERQHMRNYQYLRQNGDEARRLSTV
jgi:hypothetical protein